MGFYIPPSIRTIREDTQSSVVLTGGAVVPALIGTSFGKTNLVQAYEAAMGASATYTIPDLRPLGPPSAISGIRSALQGGIRYADAIDYAFDANAQTVVWASVALAAPYLVTVANVASASSTLNPATTYYYVVSAIKPLDLTGPVTGETVASNEVSGRPLLSTGRLKLTWRPVAGATGYRIYRSTAPGNYTGSALLTTISSGFITEYTDSGAATSAGSPHGIEVYARVVGSATEPTNIAPGAAFVIDVDGAPNTVTLAGTQPSIAGTGITYPVTVVTGTSDTIVVKVTDKSTLVGYTTTIVLTAGSTTAAQAAAQINAKPLLHGYADVVSTQLKLFADAAGSGVVIQVVSGNALALFGLTPSTATGTGVFPDFTNISVAELVAAVDAQLTGATASVDAASGRLAVTQDTAGLAHSLEPDAAANTLLHLAAAEVFGADATAGTALRRPALHADSFFIDYSYVAATDFSAKRFVNLNQLISEYGRGSNLAIAGVLAMGTAGRGNAASQVVAMSVPDDTLEAHQTALDFLMRRKDVTLVVPCTVVDGINTAAKAHCIDASNVDNKRERRAILGTPIGTLTGDEDTAGSAVYLARQLNHERAILVHPWPNVRVQGADGVVALQELDGWASAAALAGRIASLSDRATSPTTKQIFGISSLGVELEETEENILADAGVCLFTLEDGNIIVRDGITTSQEDQAQSRIQIGMTDDLLRQTLRQQFKSFRGRKLVPDLLKAVIRKTLKVLALFKKLILIAEYNPATVSAIQDPDILTNVDARFTYRPVYDVRIVEFVYTYDMTTGAIS